MLNSITTLTYKVSALLYIKITGKEVQDLLTSTSTSICASFLYRLLSRPQTVLSAFFLKRPIHNTQPMYKYLLALKKYWPPLLYVEALLASKRLMIEFSLVPYRPRIRSIRLYLGYFILRINFRLIFYPTNLTLFGP